MPDGRPSGPGRRFRGSRPATGAGRSADPTRRGRGGASALARLRDGRWRRVDPGRLGWAALGAALADVATTWRVLTTPPAAEGNDLLAGLATVHPLLAVGVLAAGAGWLVAACWLDLGWYSPVAGWLALLVHGGAGGLHNVVAASTGFYLDTFLGGPVTVRVLLPAAALLVGLAAGRRRFGGLPPCEVCPVVAVYAVAALA